MKLFKKAMLITIACAFVFAVYAGITGTKMANEMMKEFEAEYAANNVPVAKKQETSTPKVAASIGKNIKAVIPDNAEAVESVLEQCGIKQISLVEHDEMLDNAHFDGEKGYRITDERAKNIIMYLDENNDVYLIKYIEYKLFADGQVQASINDYTFTLTEISKLQVQCQDTIKSILVSPKSAKFPNFQQWAWQKEKNVITIQGYVDSQNAFGVSIRSNFQFIIDSGTITSLIFDGQELMK